MPLYNMAIIKHRTYQLNTYVIMHWKEKEDRQKLKESTQIIWLKRIDLWGRGNMYIYIYLGYAREAVSDDDWQADNE